MLLLLRMQLMLQVCQPIVKLLVLPLLRIQKVLQLRYLKVLVLAKLCRFERYILLLCQRELQ